MLLYHLRDRARSEGGFSLIELLVVVLIIGILATLMVPRFLGQRDGANNSKPKTAVRAAVSAAEAFYAENQTYTGFNEAALQGYEPGLTAAGGGTLTNPNGCTAGGCANKGGTPSVIYIGNAAGAAAGSVAGDVALCANGTGDEAYCVKLSATGATTYHKGSTVDAAFDAAGSTAAF